jgi:hypothetical protein
MDAAIIFCDVRQVGELRQMDIKSILRATFRVPAIEPEWQSGLLSQLASSRLAGVADEPAAMASAAAAGAQPVSLDMGQGSREQHYTRQRPVLRIVTPN